MISDHFEDFIKNQYKKTLFVDNYLFNWSKLV